MIKIILLIFLFTFCEFLRSESYLHNVYMELNNISLNEKQKDKLKIIIKNYQRKLKIWYIESKANNNKILQNFANSKLNNNDVIKNNNLLLQKHEYDKDFLIQIYCVLEPKQRKKLGENLIKDID